MHTSTFTTGLCAAIFGASAFAIPVADTDGAKVESFTSLSDLESHINATYDLPTVAGFEREEIAAIFAHDIVSEEAVAQANFYEEAVFSFPNSTSNSTGALPKRESQQNQASGMVIYTFDGLDCRGRASIHPNQHYSQQTPTVVRSVWISRGLYGDEQMDFSGFGGWNFNPVSCGRYTGSLSRSAGRGCQNVPDGSQCLRLWHY